MQGQERKETTRLAKSVSVLAYEAGQAEESHEASLVKRLEGVIVYVDADTRIITNFIIFIPRDANSLRMHL